MRLPRQTGSRPGGRVCAAQYERRDLMTETVMARTILQTIFCYGDLLILNVMAHGLGPDGQK